MLNYDYNNSKKERERPSCVLKKKIYLFIVIFNITGKREETPPWSLSGLRLCGWQFSSPCSHSSILRSASKWLISPRALQRASSRSRSACANISSGNGDSFWAPEHHHYFTSRMFPLREVRVIPLPAVDTQSTLCSYTILSDPMGCTTVCPIQKHIGAVFVVVVVVGWKSEAELKKYLWK